MTKIHAGITAIGVFAPENVVTNDDLSKIMDTSDEWIASRTGIRRRHIAGDDEFTSTLAIKSVENLLERYGQKALDGVDMVIIATNTPDAFFPATAAMVQEHFNLKAGAFDLLTGCSGWLYALSIAQAYVESGLFNKVLAIGSETLTKIVDWNDRKTSVLFGDGAGATIVEKVAAPYGIKSMTLGSDGSGGKHLHIKAVGKCLPDGTELAEYAFMNGREVFKFAVRVMNTATIEAVEKAGLAIEDISLFVPHQANLRIINAARERLGLAEDKVVVTVDEYGNSSTASIPLALVHALDDGRIKAGDNLLLVAFGAGLTWGSAVLTWGGTH